MINPGPGVALTLKGGALSLYIQKPVPRGTKTGQVGELAARSGKVFFSLSDRPRRAQIRGGHFRASGGGG